MSPKSIFYIISIVSILTVPVFAQLGDRPVMVRMKGETVTAYQHSFALVVGVTNYQNGLPPLPGVSMDMARVKQSLENQGFKVILILDPTLEELDVAFSDFINRYGQDVETRLLFYFAGHGYTIKTKLGEELGYIVPVNAPNPARDPVAFQNMAMEMSQIDIYTKRIQAKHVLFLFDACFSGSLFTTGIGLPLPLNNKALLPVREFITSGTSDEQVPDKSIFCSQFLSGLEGEADIDKDGYVTGTELGTFLQYRVINYSYETQHPQFGKIRNPNLDKGDFIFVVPESGMEHPAADKKPVTKQVSVAPAVPEKTANVKETGDLKVFSAYTGDLYVDDVFFQTIVANATVLFFNIPVGKRKLQFYGPTIEKREVVVTKGQTCEVNYKKDQ